MKHSSFPLVLPLLMLTQPLTAQLLDEKQQVTVKESLNVVTTSDFYMSKNHWHPIETQFVNAVEVALMSVKGDSTQHTVTFGLTITNPNREGKIALSHLMAFEREGEEHNPLHGSIVFQETIATDQSHAISVKVSDVSPEIDYFRLLKFSVTNENTQQEVIAEFRNLNVVW